jgi:hypothetical protein
VYADAVDSAKNWSPDVYEALTGETVAVGDSYMLTKRAFEKEHENDYVTRAAWGDWHDAVVEGKVGVFAVRRADGDEAYFLVGGDEYDDRDRFGFVVDTERHERVEAFA